jgi:hypothetical protein
MDELKAKDLIWINNAIIETFSEKRLIGDRGDKRSPSRVYRPQGLDAGGLGLLYRSR